MYACGSSICRGSHKCDLSGLPCTNVPKPGEWSAGTIPALWSDPPGVPGVACRRGTCGCPGIMSEPRSRSSQYTRGAAAEPVWIAPSNRQHSPSGEYRGAQRPDPAGSCSLC